MVPGNIGVGATSSPYNFYNMVYRGKTCICMWMDEGRYYLRSQILGG